MSTTTSAARSRRQLKILYVKPDDRRRSDVRESLVAAGHLVTEAKQGECAARILRNRPVNLVLVEGGSDSVALLEVASNLRSESGRVSARYTPIFVLTENPPSLPDSPTCIDGTLPAPFDNESLISAYLEFLSNSVTGAKRSSEIASCCEIDAAIDRLGGDTELYRDLVDRFLDDRSGVRLRLENAIAARDAAVIQSTSHSLKGLAASVGAVSAAAALAELEALGQAGDRGSIPIAGQAFRLEMERTAEELAAYHRSSSAKAASSPTGLSGG
jgi:HPt (histidine-containing phosphotransfer) domain-containing protein/CheY-like chemotaxis protein